MTQFVWLLVLCRPPSHACKPRTVSLWVLQSVQRDPWLSAPEWGALQGAQTAEQEHLRIQCQLYQIPQPDSTPQCHRPVLSRAPRYSIAPLCHSHPTPSSCLPSMTLPGLTQPFPKQTPAGEALSAIVQLPLHYPLEQGSSFPAATGKVARPQTKW